MLLTSLIHVDAIIRQRQQNCQCVFPSTFVVSVFAPAGAAALRRLRKRPPFSARSGEDATARLTDFCGAAAPQHRRGAPVKGGFGVATPTSIRPGGQMSGAKFGPRVDTCSPRQTLSLCPSFSYSSANPSTEADMSLLPPR